MSGNTLQLVSGLVTTGAQVGIGLAGHRGSRRLARTLDDLSDQERRLQRQAGVRRRAAGRVALAGARGGTAGGGVDVNTGSPRDFEEADVLATEFAADRAAFNFAIRKQRVLAEGLAEATAGFSSGFQTALRTLDTALDIPVDAPKPGVGTTLMDMGIDPSEAPLLTGVEPPLFSFAPDPVLNMDF